MSSSLCDTCGIVFQEGKKFCRVCGAALRRDLAALPGAASRVCTACALQYLEGRRECAFCGRVLARELSRIANSGTGIAAITEPPTSRKPVSRPAPRPHLQPLGVPAQKPLPVSEVTAFFRPARQLILQAPTAQKKQNGSRVRSHAALILSLPLIAGLGVAGWIWGTPLSEQIWAWWVSPSAPTSGQPAPVRPKGDDAKRRVAPPPSSRRSKAEAHNARGVELAQAGNVEEAIAEFRRAVSADPKNFKAHNNLGVLYKQKGLTAQAINEYKAASKADPANPVPYKNMAILYDEQRHFAEALRNYTRYLELAPSASDVEVIRSRVRDLRTKTDNWPLR